MLNIHDIKPLMVIPDYSLYIYYGLLSLGVIFLLFLLYFLFNYLKTKKNSERKKYYKILKNIQFDSPKEDAYTITVYGRLLATDPRSKKLMDDLWESLQSYKYKKKIPQTFTKETKAKFETFMDSIDV